MARYEIRLVSDDPLVRQIFADEIEEAGHLVASIARTQLATLAQNHAAAVDLVLIDQSLLGTVEADDLHRVAAAWPRAHLALLADGETGGEQHHFEDLVPVIAKTVRTAELIRAIEAAARGESIALAPDAARSRMDLFVEKIATRPAVAGVERGLQTVYEAPPSDLPGAFAALLGKLPTSTP